MEIVEIYKGNKIRSRKGEISPKSPKRKGKRNPNRNKSPNRIWKKQMTLEKNIIKVKSRSKTLTC